jgi:aspartyl-tRNA(Asn)/glutamyl-tRNA(Gln) amidotransferase subunit B
MSRTKINKVYVVGTIAEVKTQVRTSDSGKTYINGSIVVKTTVNGVENLVELFNMLQNKEITTKAGQRIIEQMPNNDKSPKAIAEELGLLGVVKDDEVLAAVKQAIDENPKAVEDYLAGQKASINFLVGQVMRITRGKADPGETVKLLKENIE